MGGFIVLSECSCGRVVAHRLRGNKEDLLGVFSALEDAERLEEGPNTELHHLEAVWIDNINYQAEHGELVYQGFKG